MRDGPAEMKPTEGVLQLREFALRERAQQFESDDRQRGRDHVYRLSILALSGCLAFAILGYLAWEFHGNPKDFVASLNDVFKDIAFLAAGWAGGSAASRQKPPRK